jgi:integrase
MAKGIHRLSVRQVETAKSKRPDVACYLPDGGSLYLRVRGAAKSWAYRYRERGGGRQRELGLGSFPAVGLAEARDKADGLRKQHKLGVDVAGERKAERKRERGIPTFRQAVEEYIEWRTQQPGKGKLEGSSLAEWEATLRLHAKKLDPYRIDQITAQDVAATLMSVWKTNTSAQRILNRVEQVLARSIALRYRTDNPASWDIQQHLLGHGAEGGEGHAALPWQEIPAFMERVRAEPGPVARALEFIILAAARAGEVCGESKGRRQKPMMAATEIDRDRRLWIVPASRMKAGVEHRIPLSDRALEIVDEVLALNPKRAYLVPRLLKSLAPDATLHGMRATFKSWAEENGYGSDPRLVEFALAHSLPDKTEASYNRVTRVEERRAVMQRWADHCDGRDVGATIDYRQDSNRGSRNELGGRDSMHAQ